MRSFLRNTGNKFAWSSLVVVLLGIVLSTLLEKTHPEWFCEAINLGGKELACGDRHSLPLVSVMGSAFRATSIGLYALAVLSVPVRGIKKGGAVVLVILTATFVFAIWFGIVHGAGDSP